MLADPLAVEPPDRRVGIYCVIFKTATAVTVATNATRSAQLINRSRPNTFLTTSHAADITSRANSLPLAIPMNKAKRASVRKSSSLRDSSDMCNSLYCVPAPPLPSLMVSYDPQGGPYKSKGLRVLPMTTAGPA